MLAVKEMEIEISDQLWEKYYETKDIGIRNKILNNYLHIVTINAKRMSGIYKNKAEIEDVVNQGIIALIECIDRYDWRRGVQFESFASIRVRGSIIDYIRKQDWVPRDIRKRFVNIENVYSEMQSSLNRQPTDEEVAEHIGVGIDEFNKVISQSQSFSILSYENLLDNAYNFKEQASMIEMPEQKVQEEEIKKVIAASIDKLSEKERLIVSLYYYEELKLKEIAVILGITASRVSQIHTKALMKMEKILGDYMRE